MKKVLSIAFLLLSFVLVLTSCNIIKGVVIKHEVTFNLDGGVASEEYSERVEIGDGKTLNLSTPTREGYNFLGWYSGETEITENTPITADLTLKAKWELITYTVSFDVNGGDGTIKSDEVSHGEHLVLPTPTREGYNFLGWFFGETKVTEKTPITSNLNLKAKWEIKSFTVSFVDFFGNTVSTQTVKWGEGAIAPSVDGIINNQRFDSWSADFSKIVDDMTVNAVYVDNTYTITYSLGDKGETFTEPCFYGELPKIPETPLIDGYVFFGWYLDEEFTDRYFFDYNLDRDITLYAKFYDTSLGEYIVISNFDQFKAIKDLPNAKYLFACDINCHGEQLISISNFAGEIEGNGFKIYNFIISSTSTQTGIVNNNTGIIKNLYVGDYTYNVKSTLGAESSFGIIVARNWGTVENCHVLEGEMTVSVSIASGVACMIGGIVGYNANSGGYIGIISNCTNRATINTRTNHSPGYSENINVGGIAGRNNGDCQVINCTNYGTINAHSTTGHHGTKLYFVGGVVGWNYTNGVMKKCANLGEVKHTIELKGIAGQPYTYTGGITGANYGSIYDCYTTGNVTKIEIDNYDYKYETIDYVGGFVGRNYGIIHNSYSTGYVKTMSSLTLYVGGFVGNNDANSQSIITKCFATGDIVIYDDIETPTEDVSVGYFAGINNVTINDCYYLDSITLTYKTIVDNVETQKDLEPNCTSGTAVSEDELLKDNFIENTLYFDRMIWLVVEGKLPTLR